MAKDIAMRRPESERDVLSLLEDFFTGKPMLVCGNTAAMVGETRYAAHFTLTGNHSTHFGPFACAPAAAKNGADQGSGGACC